MKSRTRAEDRDGRTNDREAQGDAGLRRLDAERARQESGGSVYGACETEGDCIDAFDVETDRAGREDYDFTITNVPELLKRKAIRGLRFLQRPANPEV